MEGRENGRQMDFFQPPLCILFCLVDKIGGRGLKSIKLPPPHPTGRRGGGLTSFQASELVF